jgi:hypothetical protein
MTTRLSVALVAALLAASVTLSAQWPPHRAATAPRAADGRVNLQGPVPRTAAGTPDLSGLWENIGWRELQQVSNDVSGTGGARHPAVAATAVLTSGPASSSTSAPASPAACRCSRGGRLKSSAWPATAGQSDATACRSATCSCTRTRSRARSFRPPTSW